MSESTSTAQQQGIDLDSLSLEQLSNLKQQEEGRQQDLMQRFAQLRAASARLGAAKTALTALNASTEGKEIMVPLTASLYCPGKIKNQDRVMVELGTGFYVERSSKDATGFLERRKKIVDANSENISTVVQTTQQNVQSIGMAMQGKMLEIRARQEGQRVRAKGDS
mmetsp:Transcript_33027/g.72434  ORF Transcript_33027/g.72434 Transcript_33027/m.72434 type:complete len:166 (-) Transcript_33027:260-757(-)|eukprot:CAMPEP_0178553718 /NCGR_PEP_ID=MMETSP0697-20121206/7960_1 /TAXON_ID=265572 /ORGANISM="Extubocellulus spinifer, Strain CCMP396" /LENGTH=165 /DNA_ID=CAMNT_0020186641 /DNA_START=221 /DNA_END=718 /DNA_ORIENTATION=+